MKVISSKLSLVILAGMAATALTTFAAEMTPAIQAKVDAKIKVIQTWAADPTIVSAVKEHNASPTDAGMTQEKWKTLSIIAPEVRAYTKNSAGQFLKSKKDDSVAEAFLSGADGTKVAFLSKPSNWSHKGKAKQDDPMSGKIWQGAVEVDESSGMQQLQVAVPVLDGDKPIGALVVGLSIAKLE